MNTEDMYDGYNVIQMKDKKKVYNTYSGEDAFTVDALIKGAEKFDQKWMPLIAKLLGLFVVAYFGLHLLMKVWG